jgi:hypothetical protein
MIIQLMLGSECVSVNLESIIMRSPVLPKGRALSEVAERQMRLWALGIEARQRSDEQRVGVESKPLIHPYIAFSREAGVDVGEIAKVVASKCNWKVLDRELLNYMAEHYHWSRIAIEYVDEKAASWFHDTFGRWLDNEIVTQAEYVSGLKSIVLMAAHNESTIFKGRGVQFILPRDSGLAVRVIAPKKQRAKRIAERRKCSLRDAERFIDETDKGRAVFVMRYFHRDIGDPHLYDLVLNLEFMDRNAVADCIVSNITSRFGSAG